MRVFVTRGLIVGLFVMGIGVALDAQRQRASPHETVSATVDGAKVSVTYGRPYVKGRKVFAADGLVPFGKVWRAGADEATILETDKPLAFGALNVPAGKYSLYAIPGETEWTLIINKKTGQWGTDYPEAENLGKVTMAASKAPALVEQFTIAVADTPAGGEIHLSWEHAKAVATFTVK